MSWFWIISVILIFALTWTKAGRWANQLSVLAFGETKRPNLITFGGWISLLLVSLTVLSILLIGLYFKLVLGRIADYDFDDYEDEPGESENDSKTK